MTEKIYTQQKRHHFRYYPLKQQIKSLLLSKNITRPNLVQVESCNLLLQEGIVDVCVIIYCFNGSGKTLSFLIPVLNSINPVLPHEVCKFNAGLGRQITIQQPQALIVVPTETLMEQISGYLKDYADYLHQNYGWNLKIGKMYKGASEWGHIIVGMTDKTSKLFDTVKHFMTELKWVVFDECDDIKENTEQMFSQLLKKLADNSNANFIVCSATGNSTEEDSELQPNVKFRKYIQNHIPSKNVVELDIIAMLREDHSDTALTGVTHYFKDSSNRDECIRQILGVFASKDVKNQMIIFFNTKAELANFYQKLKEQHQLFTINSTKASKNNLKVGYIHGNCGCSTNPMHQHSDDCLLTKSQRIKRLKNRDYNVMLATDVIGRGIDIRTVTLVINYSQPRNKSGISDVNYIHRAGRTGRHTDTGVALTFVSNNDLINMVEHNQKVKFQELKSIEDLVVSAEKCHLENQKNEKAAEKKGEKGDYML